MKHSLRRSLARVLTAAWLAALTMSIGAEKAPVEGLDSLFGRYDREPAGPARETLAARIDAAAHQKYATVSRLYWHTDLASAIAAAREQARPILHLRMLGRLDEDLSCANSRLFRATLYANQEVSRFLRDRFVLYWSSERPVPRVTIDYGDGRKLERTTTGNSAHYVLDESGHVLDVLPGLYAPAAFLRELEASLALAVHVRGQSDDRRAALIAGYHMDQRNTANRNWVRFLRTPEMSGTVQLMAQPRAESSLAVAQIRTMTKAAIELRDLKQIARGLTPEALPESYVEQWSAAGHFLYGAGGRKPSRPVLDETSRALIVRLHNEVPQELRVSGQGLDQMIARLEQTLLADSALNQWRLRPQIAQEIERRSGRIDFATLNDWIYAEVFRTPRQDEWLGLLPRNVFTGLPGDGVSR